MSCNEYSLKYLKINKYEYNAEHERTIDLPRPFDIITEITSGEVVFVDSDQNVIRARTGDVVFIPMGTAYTMTWHGDHPSNIAVHYQFQNEHTKYPLQIINGVSFPFSDIPESELLQMSLFYRLFYLCEPHIKKTRIAIGDNRINTAVEYIRANYTAEFTIDELAAMCHLSPSRFHYLFKKTVGYTAIDYKNKVKTDIAMQLLVSTTMSVEQISDKLNFNSSIYFRRVFKKFAGMSASQYRTSYFKQEI